MRNNLAGCVYEGADIIDSRDVIKRVSELESDLQTAHDAAVEVMRDTDFAALPENERLDYIVPEDFEEWLTVQAEDSGEQCDDAEELIRLRALADEASSSPDWTHGEALIADHYFETYAQELAEDIGAVNRDASWPNNHIDWEAAAGALQQDYFSVEYGDTTYWIRG
jgi:hypothetical protein